MCAHIRGAVELDFARAMFPQPGPAGEPPRRWIPLGDYANQSIAAAILGLLCGLAFVLGLIAGYLAYRDLPHKRTQAVVGIVLNAVGIGLSILLLAARFSR